MSKIIAAGLAVKDARADKKQSENSI